MGVVFPNKRRDLGGISFFRASGDGHGWIAIVVRYPVRI
jgi:hypothetical protein